MVVTRAVAAAAAQCARVLKRDTMQDECSRESEDAILQLLLREQELLLSLGAAAGQLPSALMICQCLARQLLQHTGRPASHVRPFHTC